MPILLDNHVRNHPGKPALIDDLGETTWAELADRVARLCNALTDAGLRPGDTIAVMMGNRREFFEMFLATAHLGTALVPVNWHWVADELAYLLEDSGATILVVGDRFVEVAEAALADPRSAKISTALVVGEYAGDRFGSYEDALAAASADDLDQQLLGGPMFYTSGTTGRPKGVRTSLLQNEAVPAEVMQLVAGSMSDAVPVDGTTLLVGPAYHSAQWAYSFMPLVNGSTVVMRHKFDAAETLELIDRYKVTNVHLVPTQLKRLLDVSDSAKKAFDGSSLVAVWHGAAPCPPPWKRAMINWFGPVINEYYGSTEGAIISTINSEEWLERGGSVGKPSAMVEVIVVDDDENRLPPGEPGTLYFRNLLGMDFEYNNDEAKTAEAHLEPGVFTTGDIGYVDGDGYMWLSDRKIDMIISGGVNIYPAEIEAVIAEHTAVADVAVIGVPNDEWGEEIKALIEPTSKTVDQDQLRSDVLAACEEKLARYKRPRSIDFVDELPRTGTGKILKRQLRAPYWADAGRSI